MATLEVHDSRGRVAYVTISREHPALIGSDPKCDVVISDPKVLPFHGRLRWKTDRFKAEAFPEARSLDLNGKKVVSASFRRGDEIVIGGYRIFMMSEGDEPVDQAKTQVQRKPAAAGGNWMEEGDAEAPQPAAPTRQKTPKPASPTPAPAAPTKAVAMKVSPWRKFMRVINAGAPPGQEKLWTSPLVLGLAALLLFLSLLSVVLWNIVSKNRADRQFLEANSRFDERDYTTAIKGFDEFLETNPSDLRVSQARVRRELANVRKFTSGGGGWNTAIEAAEQMLEKVKSERAYDDAKMDLAAEVLKATEGLADDAKAKADAKVLGEAEAARKLHTVVAGPAAKLLQEKAKLADRIGLAAAAVEKARRRRDDLAKMVEHVKSSQPDDVFGMRDALVQAYPDFAEDAEVVKQLEAACELVSKQVTFDKAVRPAETTPVADPLGPPVSLVLRLVPPGAVAEKATADGPLVYAIAQGYVYAIDGSNGAPLWHTAVGLTSPIPPMPIAGSNPSVLVFDARSNELVRLEGRTGKLVWRQSIGELINAPPLVLGNQVIVPQPSGKLALLSLESGELKGTVNFGRPIAGAPAADEAGQYFYQAADKDVVFVLTRQPPECASVTYVGQKPGAIKTAPARLANFVVMPQNNELWQGRWAVFLIENGGSHLRLIQSAPVPGWTWQAPFSQGTILWSLTDRNAISAFAMGPEDSKEPLRRVAGTIADERPSGPGYARARSDREIWISGARLARYDLDAERGSLSPIWTIERAGPSTGPIQLAGRLAVFSHQYEEGPGVAVWGIDPNDNGKVVWKTVLGADWPLTPSPSVDGNTLTTLAIDGPEVAIPHELLASGGFIEQPLPRPGYFNLPVGPLTRLERENLTILVPAPQSDHLLVREDKTSAFRRIDLPAPLGAKPVFWGPDLFVPGLDGRAYLVDPATGTAKAEPYVPTYDNDQPTHWRTPVFLADAVVLVDEAGQVRRLARLTEPRLRLDVVGEVVDLKSAVDVDPAPTTDAVIVATADHNVRSLTARDLSPIGAWKLESPRVVGPVSIDGAHSLVIEKAGGVMLFGPDGNRVWAVDLGDTPPLGTPLMKDDMIWFLSRDGVLQKRSLADGSVADRVELNVFPEGGIWSVGKDIVVSGGAGTLRLLKTDAAPAGANP